MKKLLLALVLISAQGFAQSVSGYLFSQTTEAYTAVVGTNSTATGDDGIQNNIAFGFPFNFGGVIYSTFSLSTNGWIRLGSDVNGQSWVNNLSPTNPQNPLIAALTELLERFNLLQEEQRHFGSWKLVGTTSTSGMGEP